VALTEDNDLLFIVVDGRFSGKAEGMSAKELTNFIAKHFNPQWAINMDGGGSSTMYINGYGDPVTNVLNYPCDNKKWDHYGQRARPTFFLVQYDE
jgi:exopolysaccharide biosynthesis protein